MISRRRPWCCESFQRAYERRHERGFYVYAEPPQKRLNVGPTYWMGMRSIDVGASPPETFPTDYPTPITIETWMRIIFCPWCGCRLERYYDRTPEQLYDADASARRGWNKTPEV